MTKEELLEKLKNIQKMKCETQMLELKAAAKGCPKRLYDTLSSFSNQDEGGILIFGVDEQNDYDECGVYDPQDLQKKINEQCLQMEPVVRPLLTVAEKDEKCFVSAEIPGIDLSDRPCYYRGVGRLKGSYTRIGDSDEPMTEYEVYSYEAYRKKYQDDIRSIDRVTLAALDVRSLERYMELLKEGKPHIASLQTHQIYELMSVTRENTVTLSAVLLFSPYPQAYFPQLCITAVSVPGSEMGILGESGERFTDNQRIEGNIPEMIDGAIQFVKRNMRVKTIIDPESGKREDRLEYPMTAIREAVTNALVHRDYSIHTEGMPVQIILYEDTRNPVLASAMEVLGITENRYSGIPTIRAEMKRYHLKEPEFLDERGSFIVKFFKAQEDTDVKPQNEEEAELVLFCKTPRTRKEICEYLGLKSTTYAIQTHVMPLVEKGLLKMTLPDKPKSQKQRYYSV